MRGRTQSGRLPKKVGAKGHNDDMNKEGSTSRLLTDLKRALSFQLTGGADAHLVDDFRKECRGWPVLEWLIDRHIVAIIGC
jgi:hypothetical protein